MEAQKQRQIQQIPKGAYEGKSKKEPGGLIRFKRYMKKLSYTKIISVQEYCPTVKRAGNIQEILKEYVNQEDIINKGYGINLPKMKGGYPKGRQTRVSLHAFFKEIESYLP
jgi:hypothetical protein